MPSCSEQGVGSSTPVGCNLTVAGTAPKRSPSTRSGSSVRRFTHTCSTMSPQWVKKLTLLAIEAISSKFCSTASQLSLSYTRCSISYAGCTSRVTRVITPSAPSPTTMPSKSGSPRDTLTTSPLDVTSSNPATAVARLPCRTPEPCVAVEIEPATVMWGSEARLCRATPSSFRVSTNSPYFTPPPKETVLAWRSTLIASGKEPSVRVSSEISSAESAMSENEWREPSAWTLGALETIS